MQRVLWSLLLMGLLQAQQPVVLTLTDGDGALHTTGLAAFPQLDTLGITPVPGQYRNQLLTMGDTVVVVSSGDDALYRLVVDTTQHQTFRFRVVDTLHLPSGSNPYAAASLGTQLVVSLLLTDQIALVNPATGTYALIGTGKAPEGLALWGDLVLVAATAYDFASYSYGQGMLYVHQISSGLQAVDSLPVCVNPQRISVDSVSGIAAVLCTGDYGSTEGALVRVDLTTLQVVDTLPLSGYPTSVGFHGTLAFVGGYDLSFASMAYRVDTTNGQSVPLNGVSGLVDVASLGRDTLLMLVPGATWGDPARVVTYDVPGDSVVASLLVGSGAVDLLVAQLPVGVMEARTLPRSTPTHVYLRRHTLHLILPGRTPWRLEVLTPDGRLLRTYRGTGPAILQPALPAGFYLYRLHTADLHEQGRFLWFSR